METMRTPRMPTKIYKLLEKIAPDRLWVFFATALPGKALTQYVVEHNLLKRNLGYHYYDTAMNGVWAAEHCARAFPSSRWSPCATRSSR